MTTLRRIEYKIVNGPGASYGTKIIEVPLEKHVELIRKSYPDASVIYVAVLEEWEDDDLGVLTSTGESVIILP